MATAKIKGEPTIVLELTQEEAITLQSALHGIGGEPRGYREDLETVSNALLGVGVESDYDVRVEDRGRLYMNDR